MDAPTCGSLRLEFIKRGNDFAATPNHVSIIQGSSCQRAGVDRGFCKVDLFVPDDVFRNTTLAELLAEQSEPGRRCKFLNSPNVKLRKPYPSA